MKLQVLERKTAKKSVTGAIRREGGIPAIIYARGKDAEAITVNAAEFGAIVRSLQPGRLSTTVFTLADAKGKERKAVLKEIQYMPTTYNVQHLDFEELVESMPVKIKIPIECTGVVDCVGVKLGGVLRQVVRYLRVSCLPKDIPAMFQLDVRSLQQNEVKRLRDLEIPENVRPLADLKEVAVIIAKR